MYNYFITTFVTTLSLILTLYFLLSPSITLIFVSIHNFLYKNMVFYLVVKKIDVQITSWLKYSHAPTPLWGSFDTYSFSFIHIIWTMHMKRKKKIKFSIIWWKIKRKTQDFFFKITYIFTLLSCLVVDIPSPYFCCLVVFFIFSLWYFVLVVVMTKLFFLVDHYFFYFFMFFYLFTSYSNTYILCLDLSFSNISLPI